MLIFLRLNHQRKMAQCWNTKKIEKVSHLTKMHVQNPMKEIQVQNNQDELLKAIMSQKTPESEGKKQSKQDANDTISGIIIYPIYPSW